MIGPTVDDFLTAAKVPPHLVPWMSGSLNAKWGEDPRPGSPWRGERMALLCAHNLEGLHLIDDEGYGGDVIMDDSTFELRRHLQAWHHARGHVLKTGLGMGCFVRGCLLRDDVESVTVVEIDHRVAEHFGAEFAGNPRVRIVVADALVWRPERIYDLAWHDIWTPGNVGLQSAHVRMFAHYRGHAKVQGAWQMPRWCRRLAGRSLRIL